jgi:hypothetical protein
MVMDVDSCPDKDLPFLNPVWVRHHFHKRFVASMVVEYAKTSEGWVPVSVGSAWFILDAPPPTSVVVVQLVDCHYHKGDKDYCVFYSFASVLFFLGLTKESELVQMADNVLEHRDHQ